VVVVEGEGAPPSRAHVRAVNDSKRTNAHCAYKTSRRQPALGRRPAAGTAARGHAAPDDLDLEMRKRPLTLGGKKDAHAGGLALAHGSLAWLAVDAIPEAHLAGDSCVPRPPRRGAPSSRSEHVSTPQTPSQPGETRVAWQSCAVSSCKDAPSRPQLGSRDPVRRADRDPLQKRIRWTRRGLSMRQRSESTLRPRLDDMLACDTAYLRFLSASLSAAHAVPCRLECSPSIKRFFGGVITTVSRNKPSARAWNFEVE
jgi:hypothetical protein